jgi:hypothetical protein
VCVCFVLLSTVPWTVLALAVELIGGVEEL